MTTYIGDRIQQAIINSGKTKKQIAAEVGVSPQAVTNWSKDGSIDKQNLLKFCEATGTTERWIINGTGDQDSSQARAIDQDIAEVIEYAITHQLLSYYQNLPPAAQVKLILSLYEMAASDPALLEATRNMQRAAC